MFFAEETEASNVAGLSRKTGLVIRPIDSSTLNSLFTKLDQSDAQARAETIDYLKRALNENRHLLGAEPAYSHN